MPDWNRQARNRDARLERAAHLTSSWCRRPRRALLEAVLEPGDRVCLEGNNQKQADFLAKTVAVSPSGCMTSTWSSRSWRCRNISTCSSAASPRSWILVLGAASGPARQSGGRRPHLDRRDPHLSGTVRPLLRRSDAARQPGGGPGRRCRRQPYTGPNTEDTPVIVEATAFKRGIVIAQVNELSERCRGSISRATGSIS